jgi:hypothetical protein
MPMQVGDVFAETYRLEAELARGGMGVVYRAIDLGLNRLVALKVMSPSLSGDEQYRERFRREAALAASIDHPHVVPVFHRAEFEGVLYVVMRLVDGTDLGVLLDRERRLDPGRTGRLMTQVASALDAAHARGLVHRDVKPANILLEGQDRALLTDFGLAKQVTGGDVLTATNVMLGTAAYLAPEQALGQPLTASCDVYALACVTYHCLSGRTPYDDGPALAVAAAHAYDPVPDLAQVAPEISHAVVDVVSRGLAKAPADRWPSAGAFAAALEDALAAPRVRLTAPLPVVVDEPAVAPRSRTRWWWVAGLAVVAGAAGVGVALSTGGSFTTGTLHGSPKPSADRYAAVIGQLPTGVYTGCKPAPAREAGGVVTAVDCTSVQPGAADVLVSAFASPAAMATDFQDRYATRYPDGKCSKQEQVRSTWEHGKLACYLNTQRAAVLLYEYGSRSLQVLAIRADGDHGKLYAWWQTIERTPLLG